MYSQAKDTYHARCFELEKLKRESANQKDWERAELKMRRARTFTLYALAKLYIHYAVHIVAIKPVSEMTCIVRAGC